MLCIGYNVVHRICSSYRTLSVLIDSQFLEQSVEALFSGDEARRQRLGEQWTPSQLSQLRVHSISIFERLLQIVPRHFLKHHIVAKLFSFLVDHQRAIAHHHALKKQIDGVSKSLLRALSKSMHHLARSKDATLKPLIDRAAQRIASIPNLTQLLLGILNHVSFELATRTDAVLILSDLAVLRAPPSDSGGAEDAGIINAP